MVLEQIIIATVIVSLISLIGIIITPLKEGENSWIVLVISFAAGAMLAGAFFDVLPEAFKQMDASLALEATLASIVVFFILEKFVYWHHHHHGAHHEEHMGRDGKQIKPVGYLNLIGDGFHNFFDGVAIAASFMVDSHLGIVTTIAIVAHEIPQEIGDFGLLIYSGFTKKKALFFNFISALVAVAGALIFYFSAQWVQNLQSIGLAFTAGTFIYMSCTDLIPELFHRSEKEMVGTLKQDLLQTAAMFLGIIAIYATVKLLG